MYNMIHSTNGSNFRLNTDDNLSTALDQKGGRAFIKDGNAIALYHPSTKSHLAGGSSTATSHEKETYLVTLSKEEHFSRRNVFTCISTETNRQVLCWGIPFQIVLDADPTRKLYLASALKTEHQVTTFSCEQHVYLTEEDNFMTHWKALMPARSKNSGQIRYLLEGSPILPNEPIVIVHCMTNNMLASETKYQIFNASSAKREYEVFCCSRYEPGLVNNLRDEYSGLKTPQTICRKNSDAHEWFIVKSNNHFLSPTECDIHSLSDTDFRGRVVDDLVRMLRQQGLLSLYSLRMKLMEEATSISSSIIPLRKVHGILADMGVSLEERRIQLLFSPNDDENGHSVNEINIFQMISVIRGPKVFKADEMIKRIFRSIVQDDGMLAEDVFKRKIFCINCNSPEKLCSSSWKMGSITENEFHRDLYVFFDDDGIFLDLISRTWLIE